MKPADILVRCYAERQEDGVWSAICIDFSLAAQGESFEEAKRRLDVQISDYVHEALTIDRDHAEYLLSRKAPWQQLAKWHWLSLKHHCRRLASVRLFRLPVVPAGA